MISRVLVELIEQFFKHFEKKWNDDMRDTLLHTKLNTKNYVIPWSPILKHQHIWNNVIIQISVQSSLVKFATYMYEHLFMDSIFKNMSKTLRLLRELITLRIVYVYMYSSGGSCWRIQSITHNITSLNSPFPWLTMLPSISSGFIGSVWSNSDVYMFLSNANSAGFLFLKHVKLVNY